MSAWYIISAIGIVLGAGMFIIDQYRHAQQQRTQHVLSNNMSELNRELAAMRAELEELRAKRKTKKKKIKNSSMSIMYTSTKIVDTDSSDEEFYDASDNIMVIRKQNNFDSVLTEVDANLESGRVDIVTETLLIMQNLLVKKPKEVQLMWRIAKAHYHIAMKSTDQYSKQQNINKGIGHCLTALKIHSNIADIHKWYAVHVGLRSESGTMKDRISDGHLFKKHIDIAIKLNPSDPWLYHLLGRFAYEVAGLTWYERVAASTLFGKPPNATYDEALAHFMNAERLSKTDSKENKMLIGKCHIAKKVYKRGIKWLNEARDVIPKDEMEEECDIQIKTLLAKYNSYR